MSPVATVDLETICVQKLAARIRIHRLRTGWSLEELAERAGVSRSTLHHLEHGTTQHPRLLTLHRLAKAFGVEVEMLAPPGDAWESDGPGSEGDSVRPQGSGAVRVGPVAGLATYRPQRNSPILACLGESWGQNAQRTGGNAAAAGEDSSGLFEIAGSCVPSGIAGDLTVVEPELFRDWTWADWALWESQLTSLGEGGLDRVREAASEVNRHRETRQQLQALLRSPLAPVATQLIQTLFESACRGALGGQVPSP
jgi:transcriptional regulator with XRE-family HTH domain